MAMAGQDLTLYWNGAQLTGTSGSIMRALKRLPEFSRFSAKPSGAVVMGAMDVLAEQGDPQVEAMTFTLHLSHKASGLASALLVERALMDEVRAYQAILNPFAGSGTLRVDRSTAGGASVSSEVPFVRVVGVPRFGPAILPATESVEPTRGYLETAWDLWCPLPYFYDRLATTTYVLANNPAGSVIVTNPGVAPCGVRFQVGSPPGNATELTITNTTNGYGFVWRKLSGSFVTGDWIDWFHTDPREESHIATTSPGSSVSPTGADYMELPTGTSTITALRSAGSQQVGIDISFKPRYLSL